MVFVDSVNEFGYNGVPNAGCHKIVQKIETDLNVHIEIEIQPTHTFDLNAQDAMYHASFTEITNLNNAFLLI